MAYMAKALILLILAVLLRFHAEAGGAHGGCLLSDILVSQEATGKIVEGQREYRVTIENKCACPQADVKVRCNGVGTVEDIDTSKIRPVDREFCIISNGKPLIKGLPVIFTYAFQTPQSFPVVNATPRC
ncbi:hypothetical protein EJB05_24262 [Eragrostis curvula]|uniref:Uncharacterized protein n=1 Tax=Eragrostis curvula TaxID=38414 RepID=A0A5J9VAM3_9POAL|nr:hypothetical protein EJB05_24262 [Eragrostis curvula]